MYTGGWVLTCMIRYVRTLTSEHVLVSDARTQTD